MAVKHRNRLSPREEHVAERFGYKPNLRKLTIFVAGTSQYPILKHAATALSRSGRFEIMIVFFGDYVHRRRDYADSADLGLKRSAIPPLDTAAAPTNSRMHSTVTSVAKLVPRLASKGALRRFVLNILNIPQRIRSLYYSPGTYILSYPLITLLVIYDIVVQSQKIRRRLTNIRGLIQQLKSNLIVLAEDEPTTDSRLLTHAAFEHSVPTLVVPFTIPNPREPAEAFVSSSAYHADMPANYLLARFFPHWVIAHEGRRLVRLPCTHAVPLELLGIATTKPWVLNYGPASAIAVESERMRDRYLRLGFPPQQLSLVGSPVDDVLAETQARRLELRQELTQRLDMANDKPLLLCALPPDQSSFQGRLLEFGSYVEMIEFWIACLVKIADSFNVVLRLHPRLDRADFQGFERHGLRICDDETSRLIPLCDVYVASVSATIRWAIACGKPVVNYDVYRWHYDDYDGVPGVLTVFGRDGFSEALNRFRCRTFLEQMTSEQIRVAQSWARLDGRSGDRLTSLAVDLIETGR